MTEPAWLVELKRDLERGGDDNSWPTAAVRELVGEVERLRGLLARLEWAGVFRDPMDDLDQSACPVCEVQSPGPHGPDCWLAAELRKERT